MNIEFDESKNAKNIEKHSFPLSAFSLLSMEDAIFQPDNRKEYGEERIRVFAFLMGRLCVAVFTPRADSFRIISFRKCNKRERNWYEKERYRAY